MFYLSFCRLDSAKMKYCIFLLFYKKEPFVYVHYLGSDVLESCNNCFKFIPSYVKITLLLSSAQDDFFFWFMMKKSKKGLNDNENVHCTLFQAQRERADVIKTRVQLRKFLNKKKNWLKEKNTNHVDKTLFFWFSHKKNSNI